MVGVVGSRTSALPILRAELGASEVVDVDSVTGIGGTRRGRRINGTEASRGRKAFLGTGKEARRGGVGRSRVTRVDDSENARVSRTGAVRAGWAGTSVSSLLPERTSVLGAGVEIAAFIVDGSGRGLIDGGGGIFSGPMCEHAFFE